MRRQLTRRIKRMEDKLSAVTGKPEVMFLMPGEDLAEAKRQRYGAKIPEDSRLLVVIFSASQTSTSGLC